MEIDRSASAVARSRLEVSAPIELVWEVLVGVERWPEWNSDIKSVSHEGALVEGATFRWKAGMSAITSTVGHFEPPRRIGWTGTTLGITATHVHQLESHGSTTVVSSEESWDGLLVRLLRRSMARTLQRALDSGLQHLKVEAERRVKL